MGSLASLFNYSDYECMYDNVLICRSLHLANVHIDIKTEGVTAIWEVCMCTAPTRAAGQSQAISCP